MSRKTLTLLLPGLCACLALQAQQFKEVEAAFSIQRTSVQKAWAKGDRPSAMNWKPVAQHDLARMLQRAARLDCETVAPAPRRISQGHLPYFCPNPDGRSWDIIHPYHKKYLSEGQVLVHDFGSGESRMFRYGTSEGDNIMTPCLTDFHMKSSYYLSKKLIFCLRVRDHGILFLVYDPAVNDFVSKTTPFDGGFDLYGLSIGRDRKLYGMGQPGSRDGFLYFVFDPDTFETRLCARAGTGQKEPFPYYRDSVMQGDWLYVKYGHAPWRLAAFNFKTKAFRQLATSQNIKGDHRTININRRAGGVCGHIEQGARISGISAFDETRFAFWLVDGKVVPRTDDIAPWSNRPVQRLPRLPHKFREFQQWPDGFSCRTGPPEIKRDASGPVDTHGHVALPYRLPGGKAWKTLNYQVSLYPGLVRRLVEVNPHILFAVDEGYGQHIFYDLKNRRFKRYLVQRISPYAIGVVDGWVYVSGYPAFVTGRYDLKALSSTDNPTIIGYLGRASDTHTPLGGLSAGADGCIYMAGTTHGRRRDGRGLSWVDPKTEKEGTVALEGHRVFWLTSTLKGRYLLLSCKSAEGSRIFCWDTLGKKFIYDIASPSDSHAGPLEEAFPGLVMGHAVQGDGGMLYGLEAATGKILWKKNVPCGPVTSVSRVRRHAYTYRRGPDGFIWATFGDALVRIDPGNAMVTPVGKLEPVQAAFAGNGVYVSGGAGLRRIIGLRVKMVEDDD